MPKVKYTYEQVKQEFADRGYQLLSTEYRGANYKLEYICNKHKDKGVLTIDFRHFHDRGQGCKYCAKEKPNSRRIPDSEIKVLCEKLGYIFVESKAEDGKTVVYFICKNHKNKGIQKSPIMSLKNKKHSGCKYCLNIAHLTTEEFKEKLYNINPDIEILGEYVNCATKILCRCRIDGHKWMTTPKLLTNSRAGCPICGDKKLRKNLKKINDEFLNELSQKHPHVIPLEEYTYARDKIKFKCSICGHEWENSPDRVLRTNHGCPKCAIRINTERQTKSNEQFINELNKVNPDLEPLEPYKTNHDKIKIRCKVHDYIWYATPNKLLHRNTGCPRCISYSNENKICSVLDSLGVSYELQKRFQNCRDKHTLPFDVYLPKENIAIEYDGEGHYHPIRWSRNMSSEELDYHLEICKKHDEIKNKYCADNGIGLIRIPYWESDNLKPFLLNKLNKFNILEKVI